MNIWHDIKEERIQPEEFIACIEISKNSKMKYELDKETGTIYRPSYEVPVIYTTKLTAEYVGPYIFIPGGYDKVSVIVNIEFNHPQYNRRLNQQEFEISSEAVTRLGINTFTVTETLFKKKNATTEFHILGIRNVVNMRVKYVGSDVTVGDNFDTQNLIVELETLDKYNENPLTYLLKYNPTMFTLEDGLQITDNYLIESPGLFIPYAGDNIRIVVYKDLFCELKVPVTIPGIPKIINFYTEYRGNKVYDIGDTVTKDNIHAEITLLTNYYDNITMIQEVPMETWDFFDTPIVTKFNKGIIKTQYINGLVSHISLLFSGVETLQLRCWYEGVKIEVGHEFSMHDVVVYATYNGILTRISYMDLEFIDDTVIQFDGWNFYRVRLRKNINSIGVYAVPGYKPLEKTEIAFQVLYKDQENHRQVNYTQEFYEQLAFHDILHIDWERILKTAQLVGLYGEYIFTIPKLSGMSSHQDQDWKVFITPTSLKAEIIKTYREGNETWENRKQLQQKRAKWWNIPLEM